MANKVSNVQDNFLNNLRKEKMVVCIFLVNGIRLQGKIESFDQFVILLRDSKDGEKGKTHQMIYKHAVSTIQPNTMLFERALGFQENQANKMKRATAQRDFNTEQTVSNENINQNNSEI